LVVLKTKKENEFKVAAKILRLAAKGSKEDEIMDQCKLDRAILQNFLSALAELGLLRVGDKEKGFYRTTEKGLELLRIYHRLRWLLLGRDDDFLLMRILGQLDKVKKDVHPFYVS
jgi:predicted transcriptional regulator